MANDVVVLAHRAPLTLERCADGRISVRRSAGGVVTALEALVRSCSGLWVAHGEVSTDHVAVGDHGDPMRPPSNHQYRIQQVSVPEEEYQGFYNRFAAEGLWPICHDIGVTPVFRSRDFQMYRQTNERFAATVAAAAPEASFIFVQDYQLALVPRLVRARMPRQRLAMFWHIPWPRPRVFRVCPNAAQLVDGMLGSDVIGMQTTDDVENFLGFAEMIDGAVVDRSKGLVNYRDVTTTVRCYPVGIDWANRPSRFLPPVDVCRDQIRRNLKLPSDAHLGIGVDPFDYTKGVKEKFLAVAKLLERRRDLIGQFAFVQVAEPGRSGLALRQSAREEILAASDSVNARFGAPDWVPIQLLEGDYPPEELHRLYRAADFCYVASLRDGMNLVAKEFVAARDDEQGVLILSEFAGAARQLRAAMLVNPRVIGEAANTLARALSMPPGEQTRRMRILRSNVERFDALWWVKSILQDAGHGTTSSGADSHAS